MVPIPGVIVKYTYTMMKETIQSTECCWENIATMHKYLWLDLLHFPYF